MGKKSSKPERPSKDMNKVPIYLNGDCGAFSKKLADAKKTDCHVSDPY
jgi:hypothetical protein